MLPDIGLKIGEWFIIVLIFAMFLIVGGLAIFTVTAMWLILGPGSIVIALVPCRFTSALSEGYFSWLIRIGVVFLGFYVVLATAQQFALQWNTNLADACGAIVTTLPAPVLGGAPSSIIATPCTHPILLGNLLTMLAAVVVLAIICVGIPFLLGSIAGSGVHMAMEHLASARYLAASVTRPVAAAARATTHQVSRMMQSNNQMSTLQQHMQAGAQASARVTPSQHPTTRLAPPPFR